MFQSSRKWGSIAAFAGIIGALQYRVTLVNDFGQHEFGQRLYVTSLAADVTEEMLRLFIAKYALHDPVEIERVDLETDSPAYAIGFSGLQDGEIQQIANRINGIFWHGHSVSVHVI